MTSQKADKEADIVAVLDQGEAIGLMEPLLVSTGSRHCAALADLALELATQTAAFRTSLPEGVMTALAGLVRSMNCYYSNLIEGHDTHPIDIERALRNDYSADPRKRDLQLEAKAHIIVQEWIDAGALRGRATAVGGMMEMHRRFRAHLPDDLLWVEDSLSRERSRVVPGALRWKPAIVWRIERLRVLKPIRFESLRRNEVGAIASAGKAASAMRAGSTEGLALYVEEERQQRAATLMNVA